MKFPPGGKLERRVPTFPEHIDIELTNACNLRCVICPRKDMTRPVGQMDFQLFRRIADEIGRHGLASSWLHLFGEPLLYSRLVEAIRYLKAKGNIHDLGFSTNAVLLNGEVSRDLLASGLDRVILSLDGATKETYESVRVNSRFEVVTRNIEDFLSRRKERGISRPRVWMQIIEMRDTAAEVEEFAERWKPYLLPDDVLLVKPFGTFAGQTEDRGRGADAGKLRYYERVPCEFLWRNQAIFWDGRVSACCFDVDARLVLGDSRQEPLQAIWQGEKTQELRWLHEKGLFDRLPLCPECEKTREIVPDAWRNAQDWKGPTLEVKVNDPGYAGLFGAGWYLPDDTIPPVRWTSRKASVFLKVPPRAASIGLTFATSFPGISKSPVLVRFLADDVEVQRLTIRDNEWHTLASSLPGGDRDRVIKFTIMVEETWSPHKVLGSGDMRELGIAVKDIFLQ